jgi:hypothetical protein
MCVSDSLCSQNIAMPDSDSRFLMFLTYLPMCNVLSLRQRDCLRVAPVTTGIACSSSSGETNLSAL